MILPLNLQPERLIIEIQQDFNTAFHFLKIEFFKPGRGRKKMQPAANLLPVNTSLKDAGLDETKEGTLEISDTMKVQELENILASRFGLQAQVFRKSGNLWLETTMTDNRTLQQQNDNGKESTSVPKNSPKQAENDYELNRDADH